MNTQVIHIASDGMRTGVTLARKYFRVIGIKEKINQNDLITMATDRKVTVLFDGQMVIPALIDGSHIIFRYGEHEEYPEGFTLLTLEMLAEILGVDAPEVPFDISYAYLFGKKWEKT